MVILKSYQQSFKARADFIKHSFAFKYEYLSAIMFKVLFLRFMAVSVMVRMLLALFHCRASLLLMMLIIE